LSGGEEYTLGLTPYSADTEEEYIHRSGYFYVNLTEIDAELPNYDARTIASADLPDKVDWVEKGGRIIACETCGNDSVACTASSLTSSDSFVLLFTIMSLFGIFFSMAVHRRDERQRSRKMWVLLGHITLRCC
jgi:hypothetical protein